MKKWSVANLGENAEFLECINAMCQSVGVSSACAKMLYRRGCRTVEAAEDFIQKNGLSIYDPFRLPDMQKAVDRIVKAVENGENVAIYGDYDVDGVSATSLLFLYLEQLDSDMKLGYYIPDRFAEGYGMSSSVIENLAEKGVSLIITVDTGITAVAEIDRARELGIDVVLTDHHECREVLPNACAVVNPHRKDSEYPFCDLAGVGVAFKLVTALEMTFTGDRNLAIRNVYEKYSDLATLGTIADVMPVLDENRNIIHFGLMKIRRNPRPGIKALFEQAGIPIEKCNSSTISFNIAPRLNASGRIARASSSVELLLLSEEDEYETAESLAELLGEYNKSRQDEEQRILEEVFSAVEKTHDFEKDRVIVVSGDTWHPGVIGIVASKVVERYGLPSILITFDDEENSGSGFDVGRGSGRSACGVNLVEALSHAGEYLVKFGGHELAAGLSITRADVDDFRRSVNEYVRSIETEGMWVVTIEADCQLEASDVNMKCAEDIALLEPFGAENPTPLFYMNDVRVVKNTALKGGKHVKFVFEKDGAVFNAIMFGADYEVFNYTSGEKIDIMFNLDINEYNNYRSVQLVIRDIRRAESIRVKEEEANQRYIDIINGADFSKDESVVPDRNDFAIVYRVLLSEKSTCVSESRLKSAVGEKINQIKLFVILDILDEMGLCNIKRDGNGLIEYTVNNVSEKVDLEKSVLLTKLKARQK